MAGTITVATISDGTNSTSSTNCIQGSAKAWVNFNGTNGVIRGSYNVTSVTRVGTGIYTIAFTNALANANYSAVGSASVSGTVIAYSNLITTGSVTTTYGAHTTTTLGVNCAYAGTINDAETIQVAVFSS